MRRLVLKMSMSLDGYVAGPDGELDWMMRTRSPEGIDWVEQNGMREVLLRHAPSLGPTLANVRNSFFPWPKSVS